MVTQILGNVMFILDINKMPINKKPVPNSCLGTIKKMPKH